MLALFGPTGVGKTAVALALADLLRARGEDPVAISADALQVYAGWRPSPARPGRSEQRRLEHRLVGFVAVTEPFSVGDYMPLAHAEIDAALAAGRRPIVVGGTGLYLRAAAGRPLAREGPPRGTTPSCGRPTRAIPRCWSGLTMEREALYERIDARVDAIVAAGAAEEVRRARAAGASRHGAQGAGLRRAAGRPTWRR